MKVTIWNEYMHEKSNPTVAEVYPHGIHNAIKEGLLEYGIEANTATLDEPEHGLTQEVLDNTDVLLWWGHTGHGLVQDEILERVYQRVLQGMGLIALHSAHYSRIFTKLMGTSCSLLWRVANEKERVWVVNPGHPIAQGLPRYFELEKEEMYGEFFDIPEPDELVFLSWFQGGEVFRSGCTFRRGHGKIFYFRPGHETFPTYYNSYVRRVIANAVRWVAPEPGLVPLETIRPPFPAQEPVPGRNN
ncbi:ThuA domain-containing protein [Paenibacillus roseipurpureus]|uniref:ThuA domain-containing protein n=1 Tax=Paenibacillus roseopurpureus TaxID=2918901 RepID=A0AA96RHL7_9BACL|nr:ThuA domain-containing protein [Paenibacillus sp. MBLB1832]WNR43473.1 ThuA domain-containing protein [Paenibacillus sp. MBLB1832]